MPELNLSEVTPDPAGIYAQLRSYLASSNSVLRNTLDTDVTSDLLKIIAAATAFSQQKVARAFQDCFFETALSDRAVYALADSLGIRISRKIPAKVSVTLTSTTSVVIPAYTAFSSSPSSLFNRESITVRAGVPVDVTLYAGQIVSYSFSGIGTDFQTFSPEETNFTISEDDVLVTLNGVQASKAKDSIWSLRAKEGFVDRTLPDGRLLLIFGNGIYGSVPSSNDSLVITYVVTSGSSMNSTDVTTSPDVRCPDFTSVEGTITSSFSAGDAEVSVLKLKNLGAYGFGSFSSAVTKNQLENVCKEFPDVYDVVVMAQRDIDPTNTSWMNIVKLIPLTSTFWTPSKKTEFIKYVTDRSMATTHFIVEDPVAQVVNVHLQIYGHPWSSPADNQAKVEASIQDLFSIGPGSLRQDLFLSDIFKAISSVDSVEYFKILSPSSDVILSYSEVKNLQVSFATAGGILSGTQYYGVGVKTLSGIIYPKTWVTSSGSDTALLTWDPVPGALEYYVYGRAFGSAGLLATVTTNSFSDNGSLAAGAPSPTVDTTNILYPVLGTLSVESYPSARSS